MLPIFTALTTTSLAAVAAFSPTTLSTSSSSSSSSSVLFTATSSSTTATSYVGAGTAVVDMNQYNLPLEKAAEAWTAELTPGTSLQQEGVYLGSKKIDDGDDLFVDTLTFDNISRDGGLGIELLEIAGGREDGLGITIVSGLVEGGNAERDSGILPGDSIVGMQIIREESDGRSESFDVTSIATECYSYDATIDAILSLPESDTVRITVKRLRRQPKVTVQLQYPPEQNEPDATIELFAGENLRRAMLTRGVKLNDKLSERFDSGGLGDCGAEGTCATCVVSISAGQDLLSPPKTQEQQMIVSKKPRWRMACKAFVGWGMQEGEMTIKVNPRQWPE
mmetsp:Transcript_8367/g.12891  ORF Transcript_8367/g.12891 Transcript_8367/m.12891 type:complete len:336 (+) Transcript_8367:90-1097(+)